MISSERAWLSSIKSVSIWMSPASQFRQALPPHRHTIRRAHSSCCRWLILFHRTITQLLSFSLRALELMVPPGRVLLFIDEFSMKHILLCRSKFKFEFISCYYASCVQLAVARNFCRSNNFGGKCWLFLCVKLI